jgi:hypothetical protein
VKIVVEENVTETVTSQLGLSRRVRLHGRKRKEAIS